MISSDAALPQKSAYCLSAALAIFSAVCLQVLGTTHSQPVLGSLSLLPITIAAALIGLPISRFLEKRGVSPNGPVHVNAKGTATVMILGGLLALPPIAIDVTVGFPREMNIPLPAGIFFYPGIAIVAEVVFHLVPLAILALFVSEPRRTRWIMWPVVFVEPAFQLVFVSGPLLLSILVLGNVSLVSAVQLWLFRRHGFLAMIGLRLAFYLFWHILWGFWRLTLLF